MKGKCEECGLDNVEVMKVSKEGANEKLNLCNQCRPVDGAYAY
jgi:protein-arginine kinase activator protein McsA